MKKGYLALTLILALVLLPTISAEKTTITILTAPHHEVQVIAFDPNNANAAFLGRAENYSDRWGDVNFTLDIKKDFDLKIFVKDGAETKIEEYYKEAYEAGEDLFFELMPDGMEPVVKPAWMFETKPEPSNETIENLTQTNSTEEIVEEVTEESEGILTITGKAIEKITEKIFVKNTLYYILEIIVLGGMILFVVKIKNRPKKEEHFNKEIKIKKLSELRAEQAEERKNKEEEISDKSQSLKEAEEKLKKIQEEISSLKGKDREAKLRQEIIEKEKELMKLRNEKA